MLTEGQRVSLTRLVLDHQAALRAFLGRFERDALAVEEMAQDVFLSVVSRSEEMAEWDEEDAAKYLRVVAKNVLRMRWRKARAGARARGGPVSELLLEARLEDLDEEPDRSEGRLAALKACLGGLARTAREMVERHFFQSVSLVGLARELGQSDAAVRMTFLRIRRHLRSCIEARLTGNLRP